MSEDIYNDYNKKINDIIEKYKYAFLGVTKSDITFIKKQFLGNKQYFNKLKDVEYMIYSHFGNQERKYLKQIEGLKRYYRFSYEELTSVLKLLLDVSNFKDIIYVTDEILPYLLINTKDDKIFDMLNICIKKEEINKFREILTIQGLIGIKFDSIDYFNDDFGFDFYLGNVLIRVGVIEDLEDVVVIKSFNKEDFNRSLSLKYIEKKDNEEIFKSNEYFNYIGVNNYKEENKSFKEMDYLNIKKELLNELKNEKEKMDIINLKTTKKRGYISIYLTMIVLSWILAGYTFFTIMKDVIK